MDEIKTALGAVEKLRITRTALLSARALGMRDQDIVNLILDLRMKNFYKSMTTYADHKTWQDVYHSCWQSKEIYLKFMKDQAGHLIISMKEK